MAKKKKKQEILLTPEQQLEADYQKAVRRMEGAEKMLQPEDRVQMYKEAIQMFETLGEYNDSETRLKRCKKRLPLARRDYREDIYQTAMHLKSKAKSSADYDDAIRQFRRIKREYKDIDQQISECKTQKRHALKTERIRILAGKILIAAIIITVVGMAFFLSSKPAHYLEGSFLMSIGDYERANTLFAKSKDYKDTTERVIECNYQRSLHAAKEGNYEKAVNLLHNKVGDYKDAQEKKAQYEQELLSTAEIGSHVIYGTAKWIVADEATDGMQKLLIRSKPVKARTVYQTSGKPAVWESSKLRTWLNGTFFENTFSSYEKQAILSTHIVTNANSIYGTSGGNPTNDSVFLLDESEAERYQQLLTSKKNQKAWWLRTPGKTDDSTAFVSAQGTIMHYGYTSDSKDIAVRPAIWVSIDHMRRD